MKAAEAVVLCDEDVAIDHFEQATRGVNGLVVKFLKGSVEFFESKFEVAKVAFQKEIDILAANYREWEVDSSYTEVQNFWNKRISVLKTAPLDYHDNLSGWVEVYNKMHEHLANAIDQFERLAQSRRARASLVQHKANEAKRHEKEQAKVLKRIEREALKVAAQSNLDIQEDIKQVQNSFLSMLDKPAPAKPFIQKSA